MKKIIALACSPSKGRDSDTMLDRFIDGVQTNKEVEIEKIYLTDIPFDLYRFENRNGPEEHEKEFKALCNKIQFANGLVVSTATYNFAVPAGLKNFIDRTRFFALDFEQKTRLGQPVGLLGHLSCYFLVSGGTPNWAQKILFFAFPPFWLRGVFLYFGANYLGSYYSGDVRTYENEAVLKKCEAKGKRYADRLAKDNCKTMHKRFFWRPPQQPLEG